jgi:hypothetical protein
MEHAALRLGIPQELGGLTAPELAFLQAVWDRGGFKVAPDAPAAGGLGAPKRVVVEYEQPPAPAEPPKPEPTGDE